MCPNICPKRSIVFSDIVSSGAVQFLTHCMQEIGSPEDKLKWQFLLFDTDGSGKVKTFQDCMGAISCLHFSFELIIKIK